ncbi:peptidyl-prolyl cis-trans isomerase [candidate division KSB1 bacterium]|nr:peptidyl-prolyl cis-trans isomerase [candidate division KSB1 bacterium]
MVIQRLLLKTVATISLVIVFLILGCGSDKTSDPDDTVVVKIGPEEITVREFRLSYEFGFAHLKGGKNRKIGYLEKMIDEKVLALRGYEMKLDRTEQVQRQVKDLQDELVIEQVFKDQIQAKVQVTDHEIRDAIHKSKVSWKLRYWYEPNRTFAERVAAHMRQHGYAATVSRILSSNPEIVLRPEDFETPYLTWLDVTPELLEAIRDLEVGAISDPIPLDGGFYLFQVVDIRREGVTEYDYTNLAGRYRKILQARKQQEVVDRYIAELMTPKNIVTRGNVFMPLSKNLFEWYRNKKKGDELVNAVADAGDDRPYLQEIHDLLHKTLVTFEGGAWTVGDFLAKFKPALLTVSETDDVYSFRAKFNSQIALTLRDHFLLQIGYGKKLHKRPEVKTDIKRWQDKWVYRALSKQLISDIAVTEHEARDYFDRNLHRFKIDRDDKPVYEKNKELAHVYALQQKRLALLQTESLTLQDRFGVRIFQAVLDTIPTIEFEKSRWASLQVFKRSTNRMAYPVVDPTWEF